MNLHTLLHTIGKHIEALAADIEQQEAEYDKLMQEERGKQRRLERRRVRER